MVICGDQRVIQVSLLSLLPSCLRQKSPVSLCTSQDSPVSPSYLPVGTLKIQMHITVPDLMGSGDLNSGPKTYTPSTVSTVMTNLNGQLDEI